MVKRHTYDIKSLQYIFVNYDLIVNDPLGNFIKKLKQKNKHPKSSPDPILNRWLADFDLVFTASLKLIFLLRLLKTDQQKRIKSVTRQKEKSS